jgi:hypothetical protein
MFIRRKKRGSYKKAINWRGDRKLPGYLRLAGEYFKNHQKLTARNSRPLPDSLRKVEAR